MLTRQQRVLLCPALHLLPLSSHRTTDGRALGGAMPMAIQGGIMTTAIIDARRRAHPFARVVSVFALALWTLAAQAAQSLLPLGRPRLTRRRHRRTRQRQVARGIQTLRREDPKPARIPDQHPLVNGPPAR